MKIPYIQKPASPAFSKIFPESPSVYKPLITVVLRCQSQKTSKLLVLVDSGADACLFPKGVADQLGIDVKSGPPIPFTGLGGDRSPFYFHEIEILFGTYSVKSKAGFSMSYHIGVGGILGQQGFFDQFIVTFEHKNRFLEINKPGLLHNLASRISLNTL